MAKRLVATSILSKCDPAVRPLFRSAVMLRDFLNRAQNLTPRDRARIVEQAIMVFEGFHVNLPLKMAMYAVDPLRRLRLLQLRRRAFFNDDLSFHREMTQIFNSVNDLHTNYLLPRPFATHSAWLPFIVEFCYQNGEPTYLATKVRDKEFFADARFREGVEILYWNGVPIKRAVDIAGTQSPSGAGNAAARHTFGVYSLTLRPLKYLPPPDEEWVIVGYRTHRGGRTREVRIPWRVSRSDAINMARPARSTVTGYIGALRKLLYAKRNIPEQIEKAKKPKDNGPVRIREVQTAHGKFGYVRIFTFDVGDNVDAFVNDFAAKITCLPSKGLIIDIRGNNGGKTAAAERLLQFISRDHPRRRIEPERSCFLNTLRTLEWCKLQKSNLDLGFRGLRPWIESIERALQNRAQYSASFPITDPELCNVLGRLYSGPVIMIADGLTRSAAELLAAGFQDHGGRILGVDKTTGGAGASIRRHSQLRAFFKKAGRRSPFKPLPLEIDFGIPFRRFQRVRRNAGIEIEDFGVKADYIHRMTHRDILNDNVDLINHAGKLLVSTGFGTTRTQHRARRSEIS